MLTSTSTHHIGNRIGIDCLQNFQQPRVPGLKPLHFSGIVSVITADNIHYQTSFGKNEAKV